MAFEYHYENGEANFGAPIESEVEGGAHLTLDIILHRNQKIYGLRRPDGLHDGPKNKFYFPHGLIRFGETVDEAADRLALEQAGVGVVSTALYTMPSWVESNHWHICLNVFAELSGEPAPNKEVSEVVKFDADSDASVFAWWTQEQFDSMYGELMHRTQR